MKLGCACGSFCSQCSGTIGTWDCVRGACHAGMGSSQHGIWCNARLQAQSRQMDVLRSPWQCNVVASYRSGTRCGWCNIHSNGRTSGACPQRYASWFLHSHTKRADVSHRSSFPEALGCAAQQIELLLVPRRECTHALHNDTAKAWRSTADTGMLPRVTARM